MQGVPGEAEEAGVGGERGVAGVERGVGTAGKASSFWKHKKRCSITTAELTAGRTSRSLGPRPSFLERSSAFQGDREQLQHPQHTQCVGVCVCVGRGGVDTKSRSSVWVYEGGSRLLHDTSAPVGHPLLAGAVDRRAALVRTGGPEPVVPVVPLLSSS